MRAFSFGLALRSDRVGGFAGLRDHQRDGVLTYDRVAITPFTSVIDFDRHAGEALDHEFARLSGMPTGPAGDDIDLFGSAEFSLAKLHLVEKDVAGVERDPPQRSITDGARLLVNFLEHEMLEAALFRHDRIPGHMLHLTLNGLAVEIG